jgi:DNA modification methylase
VNTVKLYQGDCLEIMPTLADKSVDLTVTSPPYDNLRTYNGSLVWNEDIWKAIIRELFRLTKQGGIVVWVVGDATINGSETGTSFRQALWAKECGFNLHDTMIYAKNNPVPLTHNRYEQQFEYMFILSNGKPKTFNGIKQPCKTAGMKNNNHKSEKHYEDSHSMRKRDCDVWVNKKKYLYNIWFITTGTGTKVKHNAPFPEKLARNHIISWSNEGDIVLDPMCGSGTTGVACRNLNRNFIGIEKDPEYFKIAKQRIDNTMPLFRAVNEHS